MSNATRNHAKAEQRQAEQRLDQYRIRYLRQSVKGNVKLASRIHATALRIGRRLVREYPRSVKLWLALGDLYVSTASSARCYSAALRIDHRNAEAAFELAKIEYYERHDIGRCEQFVDMFVRALPVELRTQGFELAAQVYGQLGRFRDAARMRSRLRNWKKREPRRTVSELDGDWDTPDSLQSARRRGKSR
jgi:Tfp pilus assembly protein PilF